MLYHVMLYGVMTHMTMYNLSMQSKVRYLFADLKPEGCQGKSQVRGGVVMCHCDGANHHPCDDCYPHPHADPCPWDPSPPWHFLPLPCALCNQSS